jgi:signal transduction histidine kinase
VSKTDDSRTDADEQRFLSMLVHELRTPLTAVRGSLGLLAGQIEGASPEVRSFAAIADRNAEKLASMLTDLAEYVRLADPAAPLNRERVDVVDSVRRAIDQVQALADERGIVLDVRASEADATIDPALIRMAVAGLLSYALRVSPKHATLLVRVETVDGGGAIGDRSGAGVVVWVADGGSVVAAESAARMFEPFSAVARRGVGPGLGLAIAQRIATLHGGVLDFCSTNQGGLFSLRLPA